MAEPAPYGTWTSPVAAADVAVIAGGAHGLDVVDGQACWAQARPAEGGRLALVRADGTEMLPAPWNARNRVHEYGGRPWLVVGRSQYFTHWDDQRLYVRNLDTGEVSPLSPEPPEPQAVRYGDLRPGPDDAVWAVRETSTGPRRTDIHRDLVAFAQGEIRSLAASHHFLTAPIGWWNLFRITLDGQGTDIAGIPHACLTFDGEQHRFRKAETMIAALEAELSFYGQVFGFATPGVPRLGLQR